MDEKRQLTSWHGILATILALLFMLFGGELMYSLFGNVGGMLAGLVLAVLGLIFVIATRTKISDAVPLKLPPIRQFFASVGIMVGVVFLNAVISLILAQVIPDFSARQDGINTMVTSMSPFMAILLVALQPAICEEFFCRGFLAASFRDLKSEGAVIFLTSLIFGCLHMDLYAFLPTALMGAAFAFIALRTQSLLIPMILHFGNNALSVVIAYLSAGSDGASAVSLDGLSVPSLVCYCVFYLGIALLFLWFNLRWFLKKTFITKSCLIVLIVASVMITFGFGALMVTSMDLSFSESQTLDYSEKIDCTVPLTLEEGNYSITVTVMSDDPVRVVLMQGLEYLQQTDYAKRNSLTFAGVLKGGDYQIAFYSEEGAEIDAGQITYSIMAVRIAL